jgi:hypothetical protein
MQTFQNCAVSFTAGNSNTVSACYKGVGCLGVAHLEFTVASEISFSVLSFKLNRLAQRTACSFPPPNCVGIYSYFWEELPLPCPCESFWMIQRVKEKHNVWLTDFFVRLSMLINVHKTWYYLGHGRSQTGRGPPSGRLCASSFCAVWSWGGPMSPPEI